MTPHRLRSLRDTYRDGLLNDVIPFWTKYAPDPAHGGYFTSLDRDGTLIDSDKSAWFQGRFAWLLATLHSEVDPHQGWLDLARSGLSFLDDFGTDPADGLMWFRLTADGRPLRKSRYRFSEAFACIAHAAFFKASREPDHAEKATQLFETFLAHWKNPALGPGIPKFEPTRPAKSLGYPMIAINMAQICRSSGIPGDWDQHIDASIREIRDHFVHDDIACVMETVAPDGSRIPHFDGRTLNPGHAIEAAWFILAESKYRGNDPHLTALGTRMLDWMWHRGWDQKYGGILSFVGVDGKPVEEYWHDMKFWWPQNETIIATLLAWTLTRDPRHTEQHRLIHDWTHAHFPDPDHGEWFGYLHRDGSISSTLKGNSWKGPFHIPRMQLTCWQLCESALAPL